MRTRFPRGRGCPPEMTDAGHESLWRRGHEGSAKKESGTPTKDKFGHAKREEGLKCPAIFEGRGIAPKKS